MGGPTRANWDDLKVFLAVARAKTLGQAAKSLGQAQPTIGRRLRALEEAVGQKLFQRTDSGFVLTDEGAAVFANAERMEEEAIAFERHLAGSAHDLEGMLRVSTSEWFASHALAPIFAAFSRAHPNVTIELVAETRLLRLARREADLVFRFRRFDEPDVLTTKVTHIPFALYAAPVYVERHGIPKVGHGEAHALITMDTAFGTFADVTWLRERFPTARMALRSNSRDVQAAMCIGGAGLAVLPRWIGDSSPGLCEISLDEPPPGRDIWAGYHRDLRSLPRLRALLDATVSALSKGR
ncbi:LysR family transcriptional regulator [Pendulispora rubella]|uniref:LysR family transcriptional regulator n=1 Tax=Pendulispora rubella TaxID=2741070 RepID=A0ABZ2L6U3_9BACT